LLADFAKFTQALALVWPAPTKPLSAATIIFCGKDAKFDAFAPPGALKGDAILPSVFLRNREQVAIVVDIEADRILIDPTKADVINPGSVEYEVDHYKQLYREYVRYLLSQSQAKAPVWLEEGLAQIIMDIDLDDQRLIYGKINTTTGTASGGESADSDGTDPTVDTDAVVGEQPFNVVLQHRSFIPFGQFFAITADAPEAQNPMGNNLWAKQAYAFVHFCMFGEDLRYQQALTTFVSRLAREPLSEQLFKECFKVDYAGMAKELRGYIYRTKHKYQRYALKPGDQLTAKAIVLREATPVEVAVIKGDAFRIGGHPDAALAAYRAAYLRGGKDPLVLAGMGVTESALNHPDRARELLEPAVKAGARRPSAYVELARLNLAAAGGSQLTAAQMSAVLTPLFEARKLPPPLPETYELIASAWARSAVPAKPENLAVLDEGIRAFPRDSALLYHAAQLYHQAGADATAASIARLGLRFPVDAEAKAKFEQLLASLPPVSSGK
jgi:tetratricopeptide (TPR) repeat protein